MHQNGLSDLAYRQIKTMILRNQLKPGQLVRESELQEMVGIGRTPVREALLRLADNELVSIHPRKGIEIAKISPKSIHDIFSARVLIEPSILKDYHQNIPQSDLIQLRDRFAKLNALDALSHESALALAELDDQFHLMIVSAMHNQYATRMMNLFVDKLTIIRAAVSVYDKCRWVASNQEHLQIIDAILQQDIPAACRHLRQHLDTSYDEAVKTLMLME